MAACLLAAPASAEVLLSNADHFDSNAGGSDLFRVQSFTTGDRGATITAIRIRLGTAPGNINAGGISVRLREDNAGNPGDLIATFENPATIAGQDFNTFTAPPDTVLAANTNYWLSVHEGISGSRLHLKRPSSTDYSGEPGWTINNVSFFRNRESDSWTSSTLRVVFVIEGTFAFGRAAQQQVLVDALAAVASRTVSSALDNIGARLGDAVPTSGPALAGRPVSPGGFSAAGFDGNAPSSGSESRGMEAGELLGSSAFSLALGAAEGESGFDPSALRWGVWGKGDYGAFEGRAGAGARYKGDMRTGWLGADARAGRWVAGLAVSRGTSETDLGGGRLETALTALWPYGRWTFADGLELRGLAGAGSGTARHVPEGGAPREQSRLTMRAGALGVRQAFSPLDGFDLAARADASFARMETGEGEEAVDGLRADSWRLRGGLEASRRFALQDGAALSPFAELAARRDGGDGVAGSGIELAGGVRYAAAGVSVEARGRWLAAHSEKGVRERGASATVRLDPEAGGRGLSLSFTPRWGASAGGAGALWREEAPQASGASEAGALDARLGYGFALAPEAGGLLTPFAEAGLAGGDDRRLRLGTRFEVRGGALALELAGERRESVGARPEHAVRLELRLGF